MSNSFKLVDTNGTPFLVTLPAAFLLNLTPVALDLSVAVSRRRSTTAFKTYTKAYKKKQQVPFNLLGTYDPNDIHGHGGTWCNCCMECLWTTLISGEIQEIDPAYLAGMPELMCAQFHPDVIAERLVAGNN